MPYDERLTPEEQEQFSKRAADEHFTRLHNAEHDARIPYRKCPECKERGWR